MTNKEYLPPLKKCSHGEMIDLLILVAGYLPLKAQGVEFLKQYSTQHTYASTMLTLNKPIAWVARQLGHTSPQQTLDAYARWIPENHYD